MRFARAHSVNSQSNACPNPFAVGVRDNLENPRKHRPQNRAGPQAKSENTAASRLSVAGRFAKADGSFSSNHSGVPVDGKGARRGSVFLLYTCGGWFYPADSCLVFVMPASPNGPLSELAPRFSLSEGLTGGAEPTPTRRARADPGPLVSFGSDVGRRGRPACADLFLSLPRRAPYRRQFEPGVSDRLKTSHAGSCSKGTRPSCCATWGARTAPL